MRSWLIMLAILAASGALASELTPCQTTLIAHGVVFRGSMVCNSKWLDREGSYALLAKAQSCNHTKNARSYLERGFKDFDRKSSQIGMMEACESINRAIGSFEQRGN